MPQLFFTISDLAQMVRERIAIRKDAIVFWTGARGDGKSTGCWRLCRRIGKFEVNHLGAIHTVHKFKPQRDMIYTRQDAMEFMTHRQYGIQMIDELVNIAYNREFAQTDQQAFIKAINQYRSHFNIISACMPFFFDLDPDLRNLCWMRIEVIKRGLAVIHTANESQYSNDPWDTEYNKKIERSWRKRDGAVRPRYHQLTTFRGFLVYNALKPKEEQLYESIRNEKRAAANKYLTSAVPEKTLSIYDNIIKLAQEGSLSQETFETICSVNNMLYATARQQINKLLRERKIGRNLKEMISKPKKKEVAFTRIKV